MYSRDFYSVLVFLVIFVIFTSIVNIVKAQEVAVCVGSSSSSTSDPASGSPTKTEFQTQLQGGDLGLSMKYDSSVNTKLKVEISYDTDTQTAAKFLGEQLTPEIIQKFTKCDVIEWEFLPCSTSQVKDGSLSCPKGETQCTFDKIHACAADLYKNDQQKLCTFILCFFRNNTDIPKCAKDSNMNYDEINKCAIGDQAAGKCDVFYRIIKSEFVNQFSSYAGQEADLGGFSGFKETVCGQLANAKLTCDFCTT